MNVPLFFLRNLTDKALKIWRHPSYLFFYLDHYGLSTLERKRPDMYVISYPKSGKTWVRILLKYYLESSCGRNRRTKSRSALSYPGLPAVDFHHEQGTWVPVPRAAEALRFNAQKYAGKKVVFLVRDPRDVMVSSWYHLTCRERIYKGTKSSFLREPLFGVDKVIAFMNLWAENAARTGGFLMIRYEDLLKDCRGQMGRLIRFFGLPEDENTLTEAVERAGFDQLKELEKKGLLDEPWMRTGGSRSGEAMKIRQGKAGSYLREFCPEDIDFLNRRIHEKLSKRLLNELKYTCWPDPNEGESGEAEKYNENIRHKIQI